MHGATIIAITLLLTAGPISPLAGQSSGGGTALPTGWSISPELTANAKVISKGKGYHLTLNAGTVLYRASDDGRGPFHASATFTEAMPANMLHGYGLLYGGKQLTDSSQRYTYFLVRSRGQYLIKQRDGVNITTVVPWTAHPAIKVLDTLNTQATAVNLVEIDAKRDPKKIAFMVNGQVVYAMDATPADVDGIVGMRAGHGLDIQVDGFVVQR